MCFKLKMSDVFKHYVFFSNKRLNFKWIIYIETASDAYAS